MPFTPSHRRTADNPVEHDAPRRWPRRASAGLLAATGGMLVAACGAGSYGASSGHTAQAPPSTRTSGAARSAAPDPAGGRRTPARVLVRHTALGRILVDGHGRTLYMFSRDRIGRSTCRAMCARFWPPDIARGRPTGGTGVDRALLGVSRAADGRRVVTYHGHPLYRFLKDTRPGLTTGEGVIAFGGRWDVLSPTGRPITGRHTGTTASPATSTTATTPATAPSTTTTQAAPAPATTTTQAAAPPTTTSGSGIPQNGGGDDDGDNHGAPSDGDGDL